MKKAPEWTIQEKQRERIAALEAELEAAAKILQAALPIGQVKAIGLLEVAEGVRQLAEDRKSHVYMLAQLHKDMHYIRTVVAEVGRTEMAARCTEMIDRIHLILREQSTTKGI